MLNECWEHNCWAGLSYGCPLKDVRTERLFKGAKNYIVRMDKFLVSHPLCMIFFCLMSSTQINFRAQQLQKNGFLFALKLKTSPLSDFCTLWKLKTGYPNFVKISKSLKCVYQKWRIFLSFFKAQFCSCEGQNTKVLCQFYDWGRSHSLDFTSAMKKGWSLLSQSFRTEIS